MNSRLSYSHNCVVILQNSYVLFEGQKKVRLLVPRQKVKRLFDVEKPLHMLGQLIYVENLGAVDENPTELSGVLIYPGNVHTHPKVLPHFRGFSCALSENAGVLFLSGQFFSSANNLTVRNRQRRSVLPFAARANVFFFFRRIATQTPLAA